MRKSHRQIDRDTLTNICIQILDSNKLVFKKNYRYSKSLRVTARATCLQCDDALLKVLIKLLLNVSLMLKLLCFIKIMYN